jgi:hypothetical protein
MWDPGSGVKFANNEPWRPFFKASQINIFNEEHRGDGVQHVALAVKDVLGAVRGLRKRGIRGHPDDVRLNVAHLIDETGDILAGRHRDDLQPVGMRRHH